MVWTKCKNLRLKLTPVKEGNKTPAVVLLKCQLHNKWSVASVRWILVSVVTHGALMKGC